MKGRCAIGALGLAAALGAGCGGDTATSPSTTTTSPVTETFTGQLTPGSAASRAFTTTMAGQVVVEMTETSLPPEAALGLALGIPTSGTVGCSPSMLIRANTSSQLIADVGAGAYCVRVFDVDGLAATVAFTVRVTYP
jgi:hypothetical protein